MSWLAPEVTLTVKGYRVYLAEVGEGSQGYTAYRYIDVDIDSLDSRLYHVAEVTSLPPSRILPLELERTWKLACLQDGNGTNRSLLGEQVEGFGCVWKFVGAFSGFRILINCNMVKETSSPSSGMLWSDWSRLKLLYCAGEHATPEPGLRFKGPVSE